MKLSTFFTFALLLASLTALAARETDGVKEGGGGDAIDSTPAQVSHALGRVRQRTTQVLSKLVQTMDKISDSKVKTILDSMFLCNRGGSLSDCGVIDDLQSIAFNIKADGPCFSPLGEHKDASVESLTRKTPICFSIPELAHVSADSLDSQLLALTIHELVHTYGFAEDDAQLVQKYVLDNSKKLLGLENSAFDLYQAAKDLDADLATLIKVLRKPKTSALESGIALGKVQADLRRIAAVKLNYQMLAQTDGDGVRLYVSAAFIGLDFDLLGMNAFIKGKLSADKFAANLAAFAPKAAALVKDTRATFGIEE